MPIFWPLAQQPENRWNSEQLYQASKYATDVECYKKDAASSDDPCVRNRIRAQRGPRGAKMTQKCAEKAGLVRSDWEGRDGVRLKSMLWVLELKLFWNPSTFGATLARTGTKPIVEVSAKDAFWGCKRVGNYLVGQNHLGRLLMKVRARRKQIRRGEFTYPDGFLLP